MPHYAYLKLKMPGPCGVITVNGNTERSLQTEEHTAALPAEVQSGLLKKNRNPAAEPWTPLRESGPHCNRTVRLVKSLISNSASVPVPMR